MRVKLHSLYLLISSHFFFLFIGPCGTVLQDTKECALRNEEQSRLVIKNLEEENEGLSTRYADLLNDLEKLRKEEAQWRIEKSGIDAKMKVRKGTGSEIEFQNQPLTGVCYMLFSLNNKLYIHNYQWGLTFIYIPSLKTQSFLKIDVAKQETDFK